MTMRRSSRWAAPILALTMVTAGCGDDTTGGGGAGGGSSSSATGASTGASSTTSAANGSSSASTAEATATAATAGGSAPDASSSVGPGGGGGDGGAGGTGAGGDATEESTWSIDDETWTAQGLTCANLGAYLSAETTVPEQSTIQFNFAAAAVAGAYQGVVPAETPPETPGEGEVRVLFQVDAGDDPDRRYFLTGTADVAVDGDTLTLTFDDQPAETQDGAEEVTVSAHVVVACPPR